MLATSQSLAPARALLSTFDRHTSFCFATPQVTLLCRGPYTQVPFHLESPRDAHQVVELLLGLEERGLRGGLVVGAVPFEGSGARLLLPGRLLREAPLAQQPEPKSRRSTSGATGECRTTTEAASVPAVFRSKPTRADYRLAVVRALELLNTSEGSDLERLNKIVLSRKLEVDLSADADLSRIVRDILLLQETGGYGFAFRTQQGPDTSESLYFGLSPELLIRKSGREVYSHPLAGSRPLAATEAENLESEQELLSSQKDLLEHRYVVESIAEALSPYCLNLDIPASPRAVRTPSMIHLGTPIRGELRSPGVSSLELALAIHPTPAVSGSPASLARTKLRELEGYDREFYAGFVGYCDASGDGEWAIALRCAQARQRTLSLYAGAGIVRGSSPESELEETDAKLQTLLRMIDRAALAEAEDAT